MDLASLLITLAMLLIVAAFVLRPFIMPAPIYEGDQPNPIGLGQETPEVDILAARREGVLAALMDLDFDHATGKIGDDDYAAQRPQLVTEGVAILKQLDALGVEDDMGAAGAPAADLDDRVERAVARLRATPDMPQLAAFCPQCGAAAHPGDRFCSRCGHSLASVAEAG